MCKHNGNVNLIKNFWFTIQTEGDIFHGMKTIIKTTTVTKFDVGQEDNRDTKKEILDMLKGSRGEFISGESIAENMNVTRAAVWKAIDSLRNDGYRISAVPNRGYMLESFNDVLSEDGIKSHLRPDTTISRVICLKETDSTNNYAKKLALHAGASCTHGTLIAANHQTSGRGRHGHTFISPPGTGLYMTLILKPTIEASEFQMITIADAVAVCLAIEELYPASKGEIKIKWVNDIYFRGRKITGILTEALTNFENGEIESVITGIGINVSTKSFTGDTSGMAGSIFQEGEAVLFSRDELCARVADHVMTFADNLNDPKLIEAYRERSMLIGEDITYMCRDIQHTGHVEGIDDRGGLLIVNDEGKTETLRSGEVFTVRKVNH